MGAQVVFHHAGQVRTERAQGGQIPEPARPREQADFIRRQAAFVDKAGDSLRMEIHRSGNVGLLDAVKIIDHGR